MKCSHKHECEQCIREQLAEAEKKVSELKDKLPKDKIIYINNWPSTINVQTLHRHWTGKNEVYFTNGTSDINNLQSLI
jgi:hypothetical protein